MNTLPAVPDTPTAGEVTGRVEMVDGELTVRLRPARVRDVTPRPVHRHYPGCACRLSRLAYVGPMTPAMRVQHRADLTWWLDPPWWAPVRWIPEQRRLRAELRADPTLRELEPVKEQATSASPCHKLEGESK